MSKTSNDAGLVVQQSPNRPWGLGSVMSPPVRSTSTMLTRARRHSRIALAVRAGVLTAAAAGAGCASSKRSVEPPAPISISVDTNDWIGQSTDWMLENYEGLLRDWTLANGGEEWVYENPRLRPPLTNEAGGCLTGNFLIPENPTHLVCFGPNKRVRTVILRGEPGWRTLPLPEPAR